MSDIVVCVCDAVVSAKTVWDRVVCDKVVCDNVVPEWPSATRATPASNTQRRLGNQCSPPQPHNCSKRHACHAKATWDLCVTDLCARMWLCDKQCFVWQFSFVCVTELCVTMLVCACVCDNAVCVGQSCVLTSYMWQCLYWQMLPAMELCVCQVSLLHLCFKSTMSLSNSVYCASVKLSLPSPSPSRPMEMA